MYEWHDRKRPFVTFAASVRCNVEMLLWQPYAHLMSLLSDRRSCMCLPRCTVVGLRIRQLSSRKVLLSLTSRRSKSAPRLWQCTSPKSQQNLTEQRDPLTSALRQKQRLLKAAIVVANLEDEVEEGVVVAVAEKVACEGVGRGRKAA